MGFEQRLLFAEFEAPARTGASVVTAVTGIRALSSASEVAVRRAIQRELEEGKPREMRFGGARGVDTVALVAARAWIEAHPEVQRPLLRVIVPGRVLDQPRVARVAIDHADIVDELGLPLSEPWAYVTRNQKLLEGATSLLAFLDGRRSGGSYGTTLMATRGGLDVIVVRVKRVRERP